MKIHFFIEMKTRIYPQRFPYASAVTWSLVLQMRNLANKIEEFSKRDDFSGEISSAHRKYPETSTTPTLNLIQSSTYLKLPKNWLSDSFSRPQVKWKTARQLFIQHPIVAPLFRQYIHFWKRKKKIFRTTVWSLDHVSNWALHFENAPKDNLVHKFLIKCVITIHRHWQVDSNSVQVSAENRKRK
jgi:hypothetical protein